MRVRVAFAPRHAASRKSIFGRWVGTRGLGSRGLGFGALLLGLVGCSISPPPTGSSTPGPVSSVRSPASAEVVPTAIVATVAVDPGLLRFVPLSGNGISLTFDPETSATVAADSSLAADVRSLAVGLYTRPPTNASAGPSADLAIVNVVDLRDPGLDETWFRDWRDTYDQAACANAGGVARRAETVLGNRTIFVGSCAGGAFTYHVRMLEVGIVVSLTSVGPGRLGEEIVRLIAR